LKSPASTSSPIKVGIILLAVAVFLLIASYFLSMFIGVALLFTPAGIEFGLGNSSFLIQFLSVWVVFVFCFVAAWKVRRSIREVVSKAFRSPSARLFDNWLFAMPIIASALWFVVSSIIDLQNLLNVPTGNLPAPVTDAETFELYLGLTRAPAIEELAFRVIPIGIIVLAQLLLTQESSGGSVQPEKPRMKLALFSFLFPDKAKRLAGVDNVEAKGIVKGISKDEWLILLFTSVVFAVAHIISGAGWQTGKVTSTFVQGLVFGVVFLAYGFHASILLHWFFNYYFYTIELGSYYLGWSLNAFLWIDTLTQWLGVISTVFFIFVMLRMLIPKKQKASAEPISIATESP